MAATESERVNLPVHRGQPGTFETWVVVFVDRVSGLSFVLRHEILAPNEGPSRALVCAHVFAMASDRTIAFGKSVVPGDLVSFGPETRFHLRVGGAELGHGFARGTAGSGATRLEWNLRFTTQREPSERTPTLLRHLPLPMRREHPHTEVRFDGWIDVGGRRTEVRWALGAQFHTYGERRVEERRWLYVPEFDDDENAALELVQTRIERKVLGLPAPAFASLWLRLGQEEIELGELRDGWMHRVDSLATGSIHARSVSSNRAVVVHAFADELSIVHHELTDPDGRHRYTAKSATANVTVEVFERPSRFGRFRPRQLLTARGTAVFEILGSEPTEGVAYTAFDATELAPHSFRAPATSLVVPPVEGRFRPFPDVVAIYAASHTYRGNSDEPAPEASEPRGPLLLRKSHRTLRPEGARVAMPDSAEIVASLLAIEPGLERVLGSRFGFLPTLLDYEVELGLVVLGPITADDLEDPGFHPPIGWFVANDLTARVTQLFAPESGDSLPYWELGKSFAGFCPATEHVFVPARAPLDTWPNVPLRTLVNGHVRQQGNARELVHTPRELLRACVVRNGGSLEPGVVLLTGTPAGIAYRVSAFRRALEERLLDRFGKLEAAIGHYLESPDFLRPGDRVLVDGGFLGTREVVITPS